MLPEQHKSRRSTNPIVLNKRRFAIVKIDRIFEILNCEFICVIGSNFLGRSCVVVGVNNDPNLRLHCNILCDIFCLSLIILPPACTVNMARVKKGIPFPLYKYYMAPIAAVSRYTRNRFSNNNQA